MTPGSASSVPAPLPTLDDSPQTAHAPLSPPPRVPAQPRGGDRARTPAASTSARAPTPRAPPRYRTTRNPPGPRSPRPRHNHPRPLLLPRPRPRPEQWWQRWTNTQLWKLRKWARGEPSLEGLVHRPCKGSLENCRLRPAGGWMPQVAWEAMLADALHPLGVQPCNLPAPQDHPYVLRGLQETLQETQLDGIRLWDITQSPAPHTHTPSPHHKCRRTDTGGSHSTQEPCPPHNMTRLTPRPAAPPPYPFTQQTTTTGQHARPRPEVTKRTGRRRTSTHTTTGTTTPKGTEPRPATVATA